MKLCELVDGALYIQHSTAHDSQTIDQDSPMSHGSLTSPNYSFHVQFKWKVLATVNLGTSQLDRGQIFVYAKMSLLFRAA